MSTVNIRILLVASIPRRQMVGRVPVYVRRSVAVDQFCGRSGAY